MEGGAGADPGKEKEVAGARRAGAAPRLHRPRRHQQRMVALKGVDLALELLRWLPACPGADVVAETLADRQLGDERDPMPLELIRRPNPAAEQNRRRPVRARGEDDRLGDELAAARQGAGGSAVLRQNPAEDRVGKDRQVRPLPSRVHVGERRVPADGPDGVDDVDDRVLASRLTKGAMPRRECFLGQWTSPERLLAPLKTRRELRIRPAGAPLVVVRRRTAQDDARVVRGAAAEDAGAQLRAIVFVAPLPAMRVARERSRVEDVRRPATLGVGPVVRPSLDETDGPIRVLAQPRREHAPGGAAAEHEDVEGRAGHSASSRAVRRTRSSDARFPLRSKTAAACSSTSTASRGRPPSTSTSARSASVSPCVFRRSVCSTRATASRPSASASAAWPRRARIFPRAARHSTCENASSLAAAPSLTRLYSSPSSSSPWMQSAWASRAAAVER